MGELDQIGCYYCYLATQAQRVPLSTVNCFSGCQLVCTSTNSCYNPLLLHNLFNGASVDMEILDMEILPRTEHPQEINSGFPIWMTNVLCNRLHYVHSAEIEDKDSCKTSPRICGIMIFRAIAHFVRWTDYFHCFCVPVRSARWNFLHLGVTFQLGTCRAPHVLLLMAGIVGVELHRRQLTTRLLFVKVCSQATRTCDRRQNLVDNIRTEANFDQTHSVDQE